MKYDNLKNRCDLFLKLSQVTQNSKPIMLDPHKKNVDFWSNLLFNAVKSYAAKFVSARAAQQVFNNIAQYRKSPAYGSDKEIRELDSIQTALQEAQNKLKAAGSDPVAILKAKGMVNVNPDIFNILSENLEVLKKGENFSQYRHFALVAPGEPNPKDTIELDRDDSAGY